MRRRLTLSVLAASLLAGCHGGGGAAVTPPLTTQSETQAQAQTTVTAFTSLTPAETGAWPRQGPARRVCGDAPPGFAACRAWVRTDFVERALPAIAPGGYYPRDLQRAYNIARASGTNGTGVVVAIVDAFDNPRAESDLAHYRSFMGLPPCTTSNGCFRKAKLGTVTDVGWGEEEALDIDMVSAICPKCHILLVEAKTNSFTDLNAAEDYATARAKYASNSWSGDETVASSADSHYEKAGKVIAAATGDFGFNARAQWPAILPGTVGVGGTSLTGTAPRVESAWSGAGSGCSKIYAKPAFQHVTGCTRRAQADITAVADPNTGVAVYDTFGASGWLVFGGTSVATPVVTSMYALSLNTNTLAFLYSHATSVNINDVRSGSNGSCGAPLCKSGSGWDGPTGLGSPNGLGAL